VLACFLADFTNLVCGQAWHDVVTQPIKRSAIGYLHQAAARLSALAMFSMIITAAPKKPTRTSGTVLDAPFTA
jgi:hypothetical protein